MLCAVSLVRMLNAKLLLKEASMRVLDAWLSLVAMVFPLEKTLTCVLWLTPTLIGSLEIQFSVLRLLVMIARSIFLSPVFSAWPNHPTPNKPTHLPYSSRSYRTYLMYERQALKVIPSSKIVFWLKEENHAQGQSKATLPHNKCLTTDYPIGINSKHTKNVTNKSTNTLIHETDWT